MAHPKTDQMKGAWKRFKGRLQEAWGDLAGDELDRFEGKREQLEGHIQEKTGEKRERIRRKIDDIAEDTKYSL